MAIHWQIPFRSLRANTLYTVNIYDSTYSDAPIVLKGGAQPFTTQEADDSDEFIPVRTQTGYIRIVDDGKDASGNTLSAANNWKAMIPKSATDRPVTLTAGNTVVWRGFIQPQTFSGVLYGNPQEREFPVCCPLTILDAYDFDITFTGIVSFGTILWNILDKTNSVTDASFQGGAVVEQWLQKKCSGNNFAETDEDNNLRAKYSYLSVLEDVCRFFGWTCRMYRMTAVFTMADDTIDPGFIHFDMQGLDITGEGGTGLYDTESWQTTAIGNVFASTKNDDMVLQGIRKARIEADINASPEIIEVPYDEIEDKYRNDPVVQSTYGVETTKYLFTKKAAEANAHTLKFNWMTMEFGPGGYFDGSGDQYGQRFYYFGSEHIYEYFEDLLIYKHSYNFTTNLYIQGEHPNDGFLIRMKSTSAYSLSNGIMVLSAKTFIDALDSNNDYRHITYIGMGAIKAALKVGDLYWNGSAWTTQWAEIGIPIGVEGGSVGDTGTGSILNNRTLTSNFPNYDGYGIPVSGSIGGIVQIDIRGFYDAAQPYQYGQRGLAIEGFKIEFLRPSVADQQDRNIYTANASNEFTGETTVDLIFASDNNNQFGAGIILNNDGSYCDVINYADGTSDHPEQHNVNRMATFGSKVRRLLTTNLQSNGLGEVTPQHKTTIDSNTFHPIGISHEWRDDITKLTLIEL